MIKSYTDLSQSKKLSEILPLESADMYWDYDVQKHEYYPMVMDDQFDDTCIYAWSLSALLGVLPDELGDNYFLTLDKEGNEYCCCYEDVNGNSFRHTFADNPIDACVSMIEKLNELNLL